MKLKMATSSQLQNFAPDFSALEGQLKKFNYFRSIRMQKMETRHSNVLAFLMDSKETHGLDNCFAQAFFLAVLASKGDEVAERMGLNGAKQANDFFQKGGFRFLVEREHPFIDDKGKRRFIDLLLVSEDPAFPVLVCIENKVMSLQHDAQLEAYEQHVLGLKKYENYKKLFLYLTPTKEIVEGDRWIKISYEPVLQALDETLRKFPQLSNEIEIYLTHYQEIIRRDIMNNDPIIRQLCADLYHANKEVYQTIFKYMIGSEKEALTGAIVEKLDALEKADKIELIASSTRENHTEFKFVTKSLLQMLPYEESQKATRVWQSKSRIVYEIVVVNTDGVPEKIMFSAVLVTGNSAVDEQVTSQIIKVCNAHRQEFRLGNKPIERTEKQKQSKYLTKIYNEENALPVPDSMTDDFLRDLESSIDTFIEDLQNHLETALKNEV